MESVSKKILIVEDEENFLSILKKVFTLEGISVVIAANGEQGANMAQKEKPDLIISDVLLPKLDGKAMAKKIRELGVTCPIIFLTNTENEDKDNKEFEYLIKSELHIDDVVVKVKAKMGIV